jgi:hypothetical protein
MPGRLHDVTGFGGGFTRQSGSKLHSTICRYVPIFTRLENEYEGAAAGPAVLI